MSQPLIEALSRYALQNVWNEVYRESRVNISMKKMFARSVAKSFAEGSKTVFFNDGDERRYMVYGLGITLLHGALPALEFNTWYTLSDILVQARCRINVYASIGRIVPLTHAQILVRPTGLVYVAIELSMHRAILTTDVLEHMYLTIYAKPRTNAPYTYTSMTIRKLPFRDDDLTEARNRVYDALAAGGQYTVRVSGTYIHSMAAFDALAPGAGDVVEVIYDPDITGVFTVDLAVEETAYYSEKHQHHAEIIHCPKALNPSQSVITFNTCDFYIIDNATGIGRYLHTCDPKSVTQITHQDYGISRRVIDALRASLDVDDVTVVGKIRVQGRDNVLVDDQSYLKMMYTCTDAEILRHLRGLTGMDLDFWRAQNLERSAYITLMFDVPNLEDSPTIDMYLEAFGYYQLTAILGGHLRRVEIPSGERSVIVKKPYTLRDSSVVAMVYLNGIKVPEAYVVTYDSGYDSVAVGINEAVYIPDGSVAIVALMESSAVAVYDRIEVSYETHVFDIPARTAVVYREDTVDATTITGTSVTTGYTPILPSPGTLVLQETDTGCRVVCGPSLYGKTIVVVGGHSIRSTLVELDPYIDDHRALLIPIRGMDRDYRGYPAMGYRTISLFINGRRLIENIDYALHVDMVDDVITGVTAVISNLEYLVANGNRLEVVVHGSQTDRTDRGYTRIASDTGNTLVSIDPDADPYYETLTQVFVNGLAQSHVIPHGSWLEVPAGPRIGSPHESTVTIPGYIADLLTGYTTTIDTVRLRAITRYFNRVYPPEPPMIILETQHRVYSPYLQKIVDDLLDLRLMVTNDPDDRTFLKQFDAYLPLRRIDPALQLTVDDRKFVDVSPIYGERITSGTALWTIVNRLVTLTLQPDTTIVI